MSFWQFIDKHADGLGMLLFIALMLAAFVAGEFAARPPTQQ